MEVTETGTLGCNTNRNAASVGVICHLISLVGRFWPFVWYNEIEQFTTRARLGRVAPLGQPKSVYKSNAEFRFVSWNGQMNMKVKANASYFQYQLQEFQDA